MKLYEFVLKGQKIVKNKYDVKETAKIFTVQAESGKRSYIKYNSYSRVPKDILDKVLIYSSYSKTLCYISLEDDVEKAKKAFYEYIKETAIPEIEKKIENAQKDKEAYITIAEMLVNNEMEVE